MALQRHLHQSQLWSQVPARVTACRLWQTWALWPPLEASGWLWAVHIIRFSCPMYGHALLKTPLCWCCLVFHVALCCTFASAGRTLFEPLIWLVTNFAHMAKLGSCWFRAASPEMQEEENPTARKPPRPARQALMLSKKRRPAKLDVTTSMS